MVDLHQFRCAISVAEHASFTRGAAAMHLSQPSVSHAIAKLEAELGEQLFVRLPREVVPTAAGRAFLAQARLAVESAERARSVVKDTMGVVTGRLNLIFVRTAAVEVADSFALLRARHPAIMLAAHEPDDDLAVADALRAGRAEVGVMRGAFASRDLLTVPFRPERWAIAVPVGDEPPLVGATLADLSGRPFVVPPAGSRPRALFDEMFAAKGLAPVEVAAEAANLLLILALVRRGVGAAMVPMSLADWIDLPGITIHPIRLGLEHDLVLAHSRRELSPAAGAYVGLLVERRW